MPKDAAQEGFVKAFARLAGPGRARRFRPWLLTIVANEAQDRRQCGRAARRRWRCDIPEDRRAERRGPVARRRRSSPASGAGALLAGMVAPRRRRRRGLATLRYLLEPSEAETAAALDVPAGTVKSRISEPSAVCGTG